MTDRGQMNALRTLIEGAQAYTLPPALLDAWRVSERVRALALAVPDLLSDEDAAAGLVNAIAAGDQPDLVKLGEELSRSETKTEAYRHAQRVLTEAVGEADRRAVGIAVDSVERIITEHLRAAFEGVLERARKCAKALNGVGLTRPLLAGAPPAARAAFNELSDLVVDRDRILAARRSANSVGARRLEHDSSGLYSEFREPYGLTPNVSRNVRWPGLAATAAPVGDEPAYLLWLVSPEGARGEPWLPTAAEMDARWLEQHGEAQERFRQSRRDAEATGARGSWAS